MGRRRNLNKYEKDVIDCLRAEGYSLRKTSDKINYSHNVVAKYFKKKDAYGTIKSFCRPQKLSSCQKRRIF